MPFHLKFYVNVRLRYIGISLTVTQNITSGCSQKRPASIFNYERNSSGHSTTHTVLQDPAGNCLNRFEEV